MSFTELSQVHNVHISNDYNLNKRRRRRRTSITAGEESEANVTCGFTAIEQNVLEEGEQKEHLNSLLVFALFEDEFYHHSWDRRLRCLRQLNQRLWIFAAFGDACLR